MQPCLRNIGEMAPFFHHPHSWLLHTCQAPTTGHCFRLSLSSSSTIFFKLQIDLLRLKRESRIYIWRLCKMGARDMEFQGLRSHATPSLEMQNSFRKRSNHSSRCCSTFCCRRTETTSWMHFIQFSRERVLRGSLSFNFLFQDRLLFGCISSNFLSQRETFILDAFHPNFLSKRLLHGSLSSNFLF